MVVDGFNHLAGRDTRGVRFGLCDTCVHQRIVRNTRGSVFSLCERSRDEPEFPRYPRVPVLECRGHESHAPGDEEGAPRVPSRA
jgi:hypothetical protein